MFLLKALRQTYAAVQRRTMAEFSFATQVLKCEPAGITFTPTGQPTFAAPEAHAILKTAAHHLCDLHETVVFPTETVYGLGAVATNAEASAKIFSTKGRPADNPLIVHVSSFGMLETLLPPGYEYSKAYRALMENFWPGPLTLLFPRNAEVIPTIITAGQSSVAIRMPSHPVARALIAVANAPLAAPSANTSGKPSPTRAEHVARDLDGRVPLIINGGACGVGLESTVVDGLNEDGNIRILRPGGITVEQIEQVLRKEYREGERIPRVLVHKRDYQDETQEAAPTTPGMKYTHYSPSVPVTLLSTVSKPPMGESPTSMKSYLERVSSKQPHPPKIGLLAPSDSKIWAAVDECEGPTWHRFDLGLISDPSMSAQRLFDGLLTLEAEGVDFILVEEVAETHEGLAVMNRVRKAAGDVEWIEYS
jgi:L-threonylcarbamoyladenylate synthase